MKIEEKFEIMFESILAELEAINTELKKKEGETTGKEMNKLINRYDQLEDRILNIRIPVYNREFKKVYDQLYRLTPYQQKKPKLSLKWIIALCIISILINLYLLWKLFA